MTCDPACAPALAQAVATLVFQYYKWCQSKPHSQWMTAACQGAYAPKLLTTPSAREHVVKTTGICDCVRCVDADEYGVDEENEEHIPAHSR